VQARLNGHVEWYNRAMSDIGGRLIVIGIMTLADHMTRRHIVQFDFWVWRETRIGELLIGGCQVSGSRTISDIWDLCVRILEGTSTELNGVVELSADNTSLELLFGKILRMNKKHALCLNNIHLIRDNVPFSSLQGLQLKELVNDMSQLEESKISKTGS